MPNWCSNRMYFSGEPAQIAEIKRLASGAVTPLYRRATNEGIQLFLAGSAGLLQITENIRSEQCPGVTAAGRGAVSPENIAFTRWLTHLQNGVLLDEQNCLMLHELWLQSGTGQRRWEELPDDVRETISPHRHPHTFELLLPLRGRFVVLNFDDRGTVTHRAILGETCTVLEMAAGTWHAVLSLDTGGIIFEVKHGGYQPVAADDYAHWAPAEGEPGTTELMAWYAQAQVGDSTFAV